MLPLFLTALGGYLIGNSMKPKIFAKGGEMELLAPNGKKSNLTPEQWHLVRTPQFKAWFGDWENSPETASKVVDENGEPLVVYKFKKEPFHSNTYNLDSPVQYIGRATKWTSNKSTFLKNFSEAIIGDKVYSSQYKKSGNIIEINDGEVTILFDDGTTIADLSGFDLDVFFNYEINQRLLFCYLLLLPEVNEKEKIFISNEIKLLQEKIKSEEIISAFLNIRILGGFDKALSHSFASLKDSGIKIQDSYTTYRSNQAKIADGTNTAFNGSNPDIRYDKGGKTFNDKELLSRWKKGESIGFTTIAHLKAKGLIPRADGNKKVSEKYMKEGGENPDIRLAKGGKTKGGDCYYIAGQFAMNNLFTPKKIDYIGTPYLVHAEVQGQGAISNLRYGHAWIEDDVFVYDFSNNRELVIPKYYYYKLGDVKTSNPKKYRKYTFEEARRKMLDTKKYGCWDLEVEYQNGGTL